MEICTVVTRDREEMVDITERLCSVIREKGWRHGVAALLCPHTTCGLTINEGADPDVRRDMTAFFSRIIPHRGEWRHGEGNSDAHIKASLMGPSLFVIVEDGKPRLGTWQSVIDCARRFVLWGLPNGPAAGIHSGGEGDCLPVSFGRAS